MQRKLKGWHVFTGFTMAFGVIIVVNLTLAFQAVHTFPGLEVKNSYVASQTFDADRDAQVALGWHVSADVVGDMLHLVILQDGKAVAPVIEDAIFGRATSVMADQTPAFVFDGKALVAPIKAGPGNWNLRVKLRAESGTLFQQRIVVHVIR
jgi:nitrogen fixation protein FixH